MKINYYKPDNTILTDYTVAWFKTLSEIKTAKSILKEEGIPAEIVSSNSNSNDKDHLTAETSIALNVPAINRTKARVALKKLYPTKAAGVTFIIAKRQSLRFAIIGFFTFMFIDIVVSEIFHINNLFYVLPFLGLSIGIIYGFNRFYYKCSEPNCGCFYNKKDTFKCKSCGKKIIGILGPLHK
jgi:hypothetical protein